MRQLEDAGAPLVVMDSLFEEQITREGVAISRSIETPQDSYAEALSNFPEPENLDLGPEEYLEHVRRIKSAELLLRLRWIAVLYGRMRAPLAVTGGVHTPVDAIKAVMVGAAGVQMVSALLRHGPAHLERVRAGMVQWLEEHEYESLRQMQGSMSLSRALNPGAYERANYAKILQTWEGAI